ncbi:hypothetical protein D9M68_877090 [compost metagenome]
MPEVDTFICVPGVIRPGSGSSASICPSVRSVAPTTTRSSMSLVAGGGVPFSNGAVGTTPKNTMSSAPASLPPNNRVCSASGPPAFSDPCEVSKVMMVVGGVVTSRS